MQKTVLRKYRNLDQKIKELETQKQGMRNDIMDEMEKEGIEKEKTVYGTFTRSNKVTYTYTEEVKKLEEKVKLAKVKEVQKGVAEYKETPYIIFTPKK